MSYSPRDLVSHSRQQQHGRRPLSECRVPQHAGGQSALAATRINSGSLVEGGEEGGREEGVVCCTAFSFSVEVRLS